MPAVDRSSAFNTPHENIDTRTKSKRCKTQCVQTSQAGDVAVAYLYSTYMRPCEPRSMRIINLAVWRLEGLQVGVFGRR